MNQKAHLLIRKAEDAAVKKRLRASVSDSFFGGVRVKTDELVVNMKTGKIATKELRELVAKRKLARAG